MTGRHIFYLRNHFHLFGNQMRILKVDLSSQLTFQYYPVSFVSSLFLLSRYLWEIFVFRGIFLALLNHSIFLSTFVRLLIHISFGFYFSLKIHWLFTCLFALILSACFYHETCPWVCQKRFCWPYKNRTYTFSAPAGLKKVISRVLFWC